MKLVIKSDKDEFEVKAICTSNGEANMLCSLNTELTVIAEDDGGHIFLVGKSKTGPGAIFTHTPTKEHPVKWENGGEPKCPYKIS